MGLILISGSFLISCGGGGSSAQTTTQPPPPTTTQGQLPGFPSGEYQNTQLLNGIFNLSWSNDSQYVYIGLQAKTTGWVALSFSQDPHGNSDTIIGYVQNGNVMLNEYGYIDYNGNHVPDTALGGTDDAILVSGNQANGITTIEFKRKLNTGDKLDTVLTTGNNNVTVAYGPDNSLA